MGKSKLQIISFLLSCLIFTNIALAQNAPVKVEKGQTAPFSGWLFSIEAEQKIRYRLVKEDYLEKELQLKDDIIGSLKNQVDIQQKIAEKYRQTWLESDENLTKALKRESRTKFMYFILGVVTVIGGGLALKAANSF